MNLLDSYEALLAHWDSVFPQQRSVERASRLAFGLLTCLRTHLTSNAICATGRQFQDWSADYRLFSRSPWDPHALFDPVFDHLSSLLPAGAPVVAALDDTLCRKTGRHIPGVSTARDPQSLPFHVNLCRGLRFVQASVLVHSAQAPGPARALPVRFEPAPPAAKPKKDAPEPEWEQYRQEKKRRALTQVGVDTLTALRQEMDRRPELRDRLLLGSGDGSYTNGSVLKRLPPRTTFIGRIRRDAKLCWPLPVAPGQAGPGRPRRYGPAAPTPEEILKDPTLPELQVRVFAAGQERDIPVKVIARVYWRSRGSAMPLQLVLIKPLGYRLRKGSKLLYRQPAFLICTDPKLEIGVLLQAYIDRWEIECNHRDEKSLLGVAQGQVWSPQAVPRLPQFQVAAYSLLLLASLLASGFQRTKDYLPLPLWRRQSIRPSLLDLLNLLRDQLFARSLAAPRAANFEHFTSPLPPAAKAPKFQITAHRLGTVAA
jgi:hypothetical protein